MGICVERKALTLLELLVVISIIGLLVGLLLPAVQYIRESARKAECSNHLKQLGLATINFESTYKHLPSGGWSKRWAGLPGLGVGKTQPGGWIFQILPFVEMQPLHDLGGVLVEDAAANSIRLRTPVSILHCPSRRDQKALENRDDWTPFLHLHTSTVARNDYAVNGGSNFVRAGLGPASIAEAANFAWPDMKNNTGVCFQRSSVRLSSITDGSSMTYLIAEKHVPRSEYFTGNDWGDNESAYSGDDRDTIRYTGSLEETDFIPLSDSQPSPVRFAEGGMVFGSAHPRIFQAVLVDGSVHAFSFAINSRVHSVLGSRADGQLVPHDELD